MNKQITCSRVIPNYENPAISLTRGIENKLIGYGNTEHHKIFGLVWWSYNTIGHHENIQTKMYDALKNELIVNKYGAQFLHHKIVNGKEELVPLNEQLLEDPTYYPEPNLGIIKEKENLKDPALKRMQEQKFSADFLATPEQLGKVIQTQLELGIELEIPTEIWISPYHADAPTKSYLPHPFLNYQINPDRTLEEEWDRLCNHDLSDYNL